MSTVSSTKIINNNTTRQLTISVPISSGFVIVSAVTVVIITTTAATAILITWGVEWPFDWRPLPFLASLSWKDGTKAKQVKSPTKGRNSKPNPDQIRTTDGNHNQHPVQANEPGTKSIKSVEPPETQTHFSRECYKEERRQRMIPILAMKNPMYDNIIMKDPEGEILSTIGMKKAQWYIRKKLAVWEDDDMSTKCIRLNFAPNKTEAQTKEAKRNMKRDGVIDDQNDCHEKGMGTYQQSIKSNRCVVCGNEKDYRRHYIVPYCYRTHFPERFKTHLPHDVVILCPTCHVRAQELSTERMKELEDSLRRIHANHDPIQMSLSAQPSLVQESLHQVRNAACALLRWREQLPSQRVMEYESLVRQYYENPSPSSSSDTLPLSSSVRPLLRDDDITVDHLRALSQMETRIPNPHYIPGSELVARELGLRKHATGNLSNSTIRS